MTTTYVLIRHGSHDLVGRVLAGRMPGVHLSARGRAEAARLAARLASMEVRAVVAGPLERVQETAAPIAARLGVVVAREPDFDEVDYGAWTGRTIESMREDPAWRAFQQRRAITRSPGGESLEDVRARAVRALDRLAGAYEEACVAIVSHGDVIKSIVADALDLSLDAIHRFDVDPASRTVVVRGSWGARLGALNVPAGRATGPRHGGTHRAAAGARPGTGNGADAQRNEAGTP